MDIHFERYSSRIGEHEIYFTKTESISPSLFTAAGQMRLYDPHLPLLEESVTIATLEGMGSFVLTVDP
jgi:hypothetical protein